MAGAREALNLGAQRVGGERAGGQDGALRAVLVWEESRDFLTDDANERLGGDGFGDEPGKFDAIDGQGVACRYSGCVGHAQKR